MLSGRYRNGGRSFCDTLSDAGSCNTDPDPLQERRFNMDPLDHWRHQDNAVWRAIGWVIPIEAGVITGAFAKPGLPGFLVAVVGIILVLAFWMYAWKSSKDRDVNLPILDRAKPAGFRLSWDAPWYCKGSFWLKVEFAVVMLVNCFLCVLEFCQWHGWWKSATCTFFG